MFKILISPQITPKWGMVPASIFFISKQKSYREGKLFAITFQQLNRIPAI